MMCEPIQENLELYALGVLEEEEARAVAEHLGTGCEQCREALQRALQQNLLVARSVPLVDPPARLRMRVREAIEPAESARPVGRPRWLALAMVGAIAAISIAVQLTMGSRLRQETEDRARLAETLQIIRAPGTRTVSFQSGALYVHQVLGLALVIDQLPQAPAGWRYESWVVPKEGAPRPLQNLKPEGGRAVSVLKGPVDVDHTAALAVSMERENSEPTKPTKLVISASL